jgi:hypothetical protein
MSYDIEPGWELSPCAAEPPADGSDLEVIVTMLELAAIYLTNTPGDQFTFDELLDKANSIDPEHITIADRDARIVLPGLEYVKKLKGSVYVLV